MALVLPDDTEAFPRRTNTSNGIGPSEPVETPEDDNVNLPTKPNGQAPPNEDFPKLGWINRLLPLWILIAMVTGILLGNFVEGISSALQRGKFVGVSIPLIIGLLVMVYPVLCKVQIEALALVLRKREIWLQLFLSFLINWIIAPFYMLALAWACLPDKPELREGVIMVGIARCIAMVLIWINLARGDALYTAVLVAFNSLLQLALFAPLTVFLIGVIGGSEKSVQLKYSLVGKSVAVFLGIPFAAAVLTRLLLRRLAGSRWYDQTFVLFIEPWSLIGLLYTILLLFALQGRQVVHQIVSVLRVAVPMFVYFVSIFFVTLWVCRRALGLGYKLSVSQSFTAASNNFELAIAIAVAIFGADSDQALAATVGPLIEVPILLGLVYVARWMGRHRKWSH